MRDDFQGYYRIPFGRYRIIYRVIRRDLHVHVEVVFVGIRKEGDKRDVYAQLYRLRRRGQL